MPPEYAFPRTSWTGVYLGFPPYKPDEYAYQPTSTANRASLACARAIDAGDGTHHPSLSLTDV